MKQLSNQDLNMQDGNTLLYAACKNGHTETAQVLIDGGANVHQPTRVRCLSNN